MRSVVALAQIDFLIGVVIEVDLVIFELLEQAHFEALGLVDECVEQLLDDLVVHLELAHVLLELLLPVPGRSLVLLLLLHNEFSENFVLQLYGHDLLLLQLRVDLGATLVLVLHDVDLAAVGAGLDEVAGLHNGHCAERAGEELDELLQRHLVVALVLLDQSFQLLGRVLRPWVLLLGLSATLSLR